MANRNRNYKNGKFDKKSNGGNRSKNGKKIKQPLNYQDAAETREYDKGLHAGRCAIISGKADNDDGWYTPSGTLLNNVAQFPTDLRIGHAIRLKFQGSGSSYSIQTRIHQNTPGILAYRIIPYTYSSGSASDPINLCGSALYTAMQVNSSRNPQYQANDLVLYLMAVTSAYSCLAWGERAYGTSTDNFEMLNDYTPGALVHAQGFEYTDIRKNLANFRAAINTFAYQLGTFYLPVDIDYVARQVFLYEAVYTDADSPKAQYYIYKPAMFLRWVEGSTDGSGAAVPTYLQSTRERLEGVTVQQWIELMESLINPLRQSDDIRLMASDLIKAFGLSSSYQLTPIADTFNIKPVYNQEVLMQFENAYILPPPNYSEGQHDSTLTYTQSTDLNRDTIVSNLIYCTPTTTSNGATWVGNGFTNERFADTANYLSPNEVLMNFHVDNPTPAQIMVASRLSAVPWNGVDTSIDTTARRAYISGFSRAGTEIVAGAQMYYDSTPRYIQGLESYSYYNVSTSMFRVVQSIDEVPSLVNFIYHLTGLLDAWDWHPKINFGIATNDAATKTITLSASQFIYDLETWMTITLDEWDRMNLIALYGLFECTLGEVPKLR